MINQTRLSDAEYLVQILEDHDRQLRELKGTTAGSGVTTVNAGTGLSGGGSGASVTLSLSTPVSVANGGTGSANASAARTALGVAIGSDVQAYNTNTTILGNTTTGSGSIVLATSPTIVTPTVASLTNMQHTHQNAAGGGTLDAAAIASGTLSNSRLDAELAALAGLTSAADKIPYFTGSGTAGTEDFYAGSWHTYTPTWTTSGTSPSLGNGTLTGRYMKIGRTVHVVVEFTAGSTTTFGTGTWSFTLPLTAGGAGNLLPIGFVYFEDVGVAGYLGAMRKETSTTFIPATIGTASTYAGLDVTSNTKPFSWGNTDYFKAAGTYETNA